MFYNCPVRKLASHSPPFCENTTHTQALTGTDSHSRARAHIRGHTLRHTCTDVRPMQLLLARGSQVGLGLRGEDPDRGPACTPQLWHAPSSCAAGPAGGCSVCPWQARPQVLLWTLCGEVAPRFPRRVTSRSSSLKAASHVSPLAAPGAPEGQRLPGLLFFIIREVGVGSPVLEERTDMQGPCLR